MKKIIEKVLLIIFGYVLFFSTVIGINILLYKVLGGYFSIYNVDNVIKNDGNDILIIYIILCILYFMTNYIKNYFEVKKLNQKLKSKDENNAR